MKSNKIIRWFDAGIWPASIVFCCGFSYDEIIKHFSKVKANGWATGISQDKAFIDSDNYFALKRTVENKVTGKEVTYFYIIFRNQFDFSDFAFCTLAHEVLHICQFMLPDMTNMEREYEAVAYTHTYIMQSILKELRKK